ncbi:MAG: guanine deaminase [Bacteroidetes bacterium]|nr:guanine deaminase [Bacteroidota bacterium]
MNAPFRIHAPVVSPSGRDRIAWHPRGVVAVDEDGRILFRGDEDDLPESLTALPAISCGDVLLPGMIDAHVHLPQFDCRGKFGATLMEWLDRFIYPEEMRFAQETVARDTARRFYHALLEAGTTTAMVYGSVHERATHIAFEEAERAGLRIILGNVLMDRGAPAALLLSTKEALVASERLIETWHRKTPLLSYAITPRFAPTCTPELLRGAGALAAKHDTWVQTHINETSGEIARVRELFPESAHYTGVYREAGLLGDRTVLGHNIHTDDEQMEVLREHNCAVAHCPDSNLFLGSGRFPLERHEQYGIRTALGSDVGAGTTLSMLHVMRTMSYVQGRSLHPFLPLFHATLGGAEALGLANETGSLEVGKSADMITVHVERQFCRGKTLQDLSDVEIASVLVYRTPETVVRRVWIRGKEAGSA